MTRFLGYGRQDVDRHDIESVVAVLSSDFLTQGPAVERFEAALAERCGARYAVAVSNGTAALHVACLAAGAGPGDRGLTAAITFAASANCLLYSGADVGFIDIDRHSLGMSVTALRHAMAESPDAKIVIPVHMAGLADGIEQIHGLANGRTVIEDGAQSLGGTYADGRPVGCCAHSAMTTFSFHPVKSITTGEGGAVLTNDAELARRLRLLRSHGIERDAGRMLGPDLMENGRVKPWIGQQQMLGFNYRMTDIQAALGVSQLARLDQFIARRRAIAKRYDEAFSNPPQITLPQSSVEHRQRSALHLYVIHVDFAALGATRTAFMDRLRQRRIGSQVHYVPVYHHPYHASRSKVDPADFPESERYYRGCLSLPLYPGLTDEDVERVISATADALAS